MTQPPQDLDAERSVLGALLLSADARREVIDSGLLAAGDFYRPAHETIYATVTALHQAGDPVDPVAVAAQLAVAGHRRTGGAAYLQECMQACSSPSAAGHHARILQAFAVRRRLAAAGNRITQMATDDSVDLQAALTEATTSVAEVAAVAPEDTRPRRSIRLTSAADVRPERVRWLWDGRIPMSALSLLAGREGLGKSTVAVDLAAQITLGTCDGELHGVPRDVIYVATEDSLPHTVVPRLVAAGADLDRVHLIEGVTDVDGLGDRLTLPRDVELLTEVIRKHGVALVVLDAATSVLDGSLDGDRDRQMRRALEPLSGVGVATGASILGIVHLGKAATSDVGRAILGTIAWSQVARSVLAVAKNNQTDTLVISLTKTNLSGPVPSIGARIVSETVPTDDGDKASVGRIEWLGTTDTDARDLLAPMAAEDDDDRSAAEEAGAWLVDWLALQGGEANRQDVEKACRAAGHALRALQRGRSAVGVQYRPEGFPRRTVWFLDPAALAEAQSRQQSRQDVPDETAGQEQSRQSRQSRHDAPPAWHDSSAQSRQTDAPVGATGATGATGSDLRFSDGTIGATAGATECHCGRTESMHPKGAWGECLGCGVRHHRHGPGGRSHCTTCQP